MDVSIALFASVFVGIVFRTRVVDSTRACSINEWLLQAGGFFLGFSIAHDAVIHLLGREAQPFMAYLACLAFAVTLAGRRLVDALRVRQRPAGDRG